MTNKKPRPRTGGGVLTLLLALGFVGILALLLPPQVLAQSPWESSAQKLQTAFTGPIAKALSLVAIVVGGLMFAYGEGQGKKVVAGIVFGVGMAVGAMNFLAWLF